MLPFIEGRYNPRRRHSALGDKLPDEFEATTLVAALSALEDDARLHRAGTR